MTPAPSLVMVPGRVTVVVASYNHARFLGRRLDSLLAQTYPDVEMLVIDDCSTDDSRSVLRAYGDRLVLTERRTNGGWVVTFNQGVSQATGEYLLFANCDDICHPDLIATLVAALTAAPTAGIAFCRSRLIDDMDREIGDDRSVQHPAFGERCASDTVIAGADMLRYLLRGCVIPNTSAALFRRECFERVGLFSSSFPICGDWEYYFRLSEHYDTAYVATPLNGFRQHATTVRRRNRARLTYDEVLRLLLVWGARVCPADDDRARARADAMHLWAAHLIGPQVRGLVDAPHHLRLIWALDRRALAHAPAAIVRRAGTLLRKAVQGT